MFTWIYDLPNWLLFVLFIVVALALAWGSVFLFRSRTAELFRGEDGESRNSLLDLVLTGTGLFYGLLLGLIAAATYSTYSDAADTVASEATSIAALYRDVSGYPEPIRGQLRGDLEHYVHYVINDAWPAQRRGEIPTEGVVLSSRMLDRLTAFEPPTSGKEIVHAETFKQFNNFIEKRRERLNAVTASLPTALWVVLVLGAVVNLALMAMLAVERLAAHLVVSGMFAFFVGMMIFLIAALDNPFLGEFSVEPTPLVLLQENLLGK
ncbi:DUF4239 domain-containing protein [Amycolatopsis anabasis]|uniref:bestrophin-like domain n=1 Tax=Amycolatopsis anabasis TaxID=1840409 RepID=UPI00131BC627|nr:DUF4239 domain-containing protein [Amycolatopsis anabasis]